MDYITVTKENIPGAIFSTGMYSRALVITLPVFHPILNTLVVDIFPICTDGNIHLGCRETVALQQLNLSECLGRISAEVARQVHDYCNDPFDVSDWLNPEGKKEVFTRDLAEDFQHRIDTKRVVIELVAGIMEEDIEITEFLPDVMGRCEEKYPTDFSREPGLNETLFHLLNATLEYTLKGTGINEVAELYKFLSE